MRIALFYHSLVSDWNHGNAHFLRGIATEMVRRGHELRIFEPENSWSRQNLIAEYGDCPINEFKEHYPLLQSIRYDRIDLGKALDGIDLVIVHEWNTHDLVRQIGEHRPNGSVLLFHDTHHRGVTDPQGIAAYALSNYDGVLAYGNALREIYLRQGWARRAWTWHEAADTRVFQPVPHRRPTHDLVWIGNWGDDERTAELKEFLIEPTKALKLKARVYGVRYPVEARQLLAQAGIDYYGWLPNYRVPEVFSQNKVTIHIPRRPYVEALRGIPTIRPFEALACGIPLVCSPWHDDESLFSPGKDFLIARDGREMARHLHALLADKSMARELSQNGLRTIRDRHTCAHRVDELFEIYKEVKSNACMPD